MFVERSTQYTSFSSRKQPANAGTERKQFTENASVALQQPILTHAHTKCPPVIHVYSKKCLKQRGQPPPPPHPPLSPEKSRYSKKRLLATAVICN